MPVLPSLAALLLGVATALLVACGSDGRIPSGDASSLESVLNSVSTAYNNGSCRAAEQDVVKARGELLKLPSSVDADLRARLRSGVDNLAKRVAATCGQQQTQTQQTQTQETETGTTDTGTTDTGTTETTTTETTTTETQPTESTGTTTGGTTGTDTGTTGTGTGTTDGTGGASPGGGG